MFTLSIISLFLYLLVPTKLNFSTFELAFFPRQFAEGIYHKISEMIEGELMLMNSNHFVKI